tara:strand:+ start:1798 stop:2022 length:225 start_codon:yes stop_codon:yes gene_type:complete
MKKRMNVSQAKDIAGRDKPYWVRIGTAFEENGKITGIKLDVLPLPNKDGEVWLRLFDDDRKQDGVPAQQGSPWG